MMSIAHVIWAKIQLRQDEFRSTYESVLKIRLDVKSNLSQRADLLLFRERWMELGVYEAIGSSRGA